NANTRTIRTRSNYARNGPRASGLVRRVPDGPAVAGPARPCLPAPLARSCALGRAGLADLLGRAIHTAGCVFLFSGPCAQMGRLHDQLSRATLTTAASELIAHRAC